MGRFAVKWWHRNEKGTDCVSVRRNTSGGGSTRCGLLISAVDFPPSACAALRRAVGDMTCCDAATDAVGLISAACDLPMGDDATLKLKAPPPPAVGEPAAMGESKSARPAAVGVFSVCCG